MSVPRAASRIIAPTVLRSIAIRQRGINGLRPHLNGKLPAIAILIPRREIGTETSTQGSGNNGPPPGFDIKEAQKPIPKQEQQKKAQPTAEELKEQVKIPAGVPTGVAPTSAQEARSLSELAAEKAAADKSEEAKKAVTKKEEEKQKLTLWQKVKKEAHHYWDGTKLLATEVKISSRLALKMAAGYELTRRENRQLQRTVQDLGRLVPFSVFVIVPFAELLLPVALKLFPNMLPSTYEGASQKESKASQLRTTRKKVSDLLRQTLKESGLPVTASTAQKEEFTEFFRKLRTTGETVSKADVIKVCKTFKDDLTLDNLSRPQLVGICRYMNLNAVGPDGLLRYNIRHRMRQIKRDDKAISYEGVDSLSVPELQTACQSRGLRTHGVSPARLRDDLQMWLDLRLKYGVPSTLLVLSNAFMYSGQTQASAEQGELNTQIEALQAVLSSIPEELFHEIELEVHNAEGAATNKQRLEVLKEQQELIEEENEKAKESPSVRDEEDIDDKEERAAAAEGEVAVDEADAKTTPDKEAKSEAGTKEASTEAATTELKGEETEKEKAEAAKKE